MSRINNMKQGQQNGPVVVQRVSVASRKCSLQRGKSRSSDVGRESQVTLEHVLGMSASSNNALSYDQMSGCVLYTAGCICVLYNIKKNRQTHIQNVSKKPLTCVAFSSDGKLVVTGESGHQPCVRVWDVTTGTQLSELQGHRFGISSVNFSPNSKCVVSVGFTHDSNVNIWNWKTSKQVASNKVSSRVFGMSFDESGKYFVTVGVRFVKFWYFDTTDDKKLNQLSPCENRAAILDSHRNNTFKAVACGRGEFQHMTFTLSIDGRLFSIGQSRRVERWLDLKVTDAFALYVTSKHLICGCSDGVVRVFEPSTLAHLVNLPKPHPLGVNLAACTSPSCMVSILSTSEFPDCVGVISDAINNKIVTLYRDRSLYVWDIADLQRIGKYRSFLYHSACVCALEVYPTPDLETPSYLPKGTFFTGSSDNTIKIWNLTPDAENPLKRNIYSKELLNMIYTDLDFTWMRNKKGHAFSDNLNGITALAISPTGESISSGDKSGNLRVYSLTTQDCSKIALIEAHDAEILSITYTSPESYWYYLATASRDRLIHIFDIRAEYSLVQTISDHSAIVTSIKFVERPQDSQPTMLSCSADKSVMFRTGYKVVGGGNQLQFQTYQHVQEKSTFNDMDIPPNKTSVITGCQDRYIRTYELSTGKCLRSFKSGGVEDSGMIVHVTLDPSGTFIAAAGSDKCIFIHEFASGDRVESLYGHSEMITGMKFTNDCKRLITISGDGCILVWRLSNDLVKNIKNKMKNQGFEPEPSIDTPLANRKDHEAAQIHYPSLVSPTKSPLNKTFSLPEEHSIPDIPPGRPLSPPIEPRPASVDIPFKPPSQIVEIPVSPRSTPEFAKKKRANWGAPAKLSFLENNSSLILSEVSPDNSGIRTGPYGGSESDEPEQHITPPKDLPFDGIELSDDDSPEQDEKEEVIYAPPKIRSPTSQNKRLSHCFDIMETPTKGDVESIDENPESDPSCVDLEDVEEEESGEDNALATRYTELPVEEFEASLIMSPASAHRHSMSRKFLKSSTPVGSPIAMIKRIFSPKPEKSKRPDSFTPAEDNTVKALKPTEQQIKHAAEQKIQNKKAVNGTLTRPKALDSNKENRNKDFTDLRENTRFITNRSVSPIGGPFYEVQPNILRSKASSGSDSSSSRYVSLPATSESANGTDRSRKDSSSSTKESKVRKDSLSSVNSNKGFVSSGKEDKPKTATKKAGITNKLFNITRKEPKAPKEDKKSQNARKDKEKAKATALAKKTEEKMVKKPSEKTKENDVFEKLQTVFNESLAYHQKLLQAPKTDHTQAQLMKSENMFQWIQSKLQENGVTTEDSGSQTDLFSTSNGPCSSTQHAEQCAELCAERILSIVEKRLSSNTSNA